MPKRKAAKRELISAGTDKAIRPPRRKRSVQRIRRCWPFIEAGPSAEGKAEGEEGMGV